MNHPLRGFILEHRDRIITQVAERVRLRTLADASRAGLEHGVPLFLSQLSDALTREEHRPAQVTAESIQSDPLVAIDPPSSGPAHTRKQIIDSASLHGEALLKHGFTVAQVVHGYGDVCQTVTELASELGVRISSEDFQVFNRCLDDAIAGAVTAYSTQRERDQDYAGTERLGILAHEMRNLLNTAVLSFDAIKRGTVGSGGSTGALHTRSLTGLRALVDRSLSVVRLEAGAPALKPVSLAQFIEEVEIGATMLAEAYGVHLYVSPVPSDVLIEVDRQLLASAVSNLLQNAFKFTHAGGKVSLESNATERGVLIAVSDQCGGLPPEQMERLFQPFSRGAKDQSGLGLGLSIARSAAKANRGEVQVTNVPDYGCIFTVSLPRYSKPADSESRLPH